MFTPPKDSLKGLLKQWQPKPPYSQEKLVQDTLREIRQLPSFSISDRIRGFWTELVEPWIPSPNFLLPVATVAILAVMGFQWQQSNRQVETLTAYQWHASLANPLSEVSLAGSYSKFHVKDSYAQ
jgi:hypothetical protein